MADRSRWPRASYYFAGRPFRPTVSDTLRRPLPGTRRGIAPTTACGTFFLVASASMRLSAAPPEGSLGAITVLFPRCDLSGLAPSTAVGSPALISPFVALTGLDRSDRLGRVLVLFPRCDLSGLDHGGECGQVELRRCVDLAGVAALAAVGLLELRRCIDLAGLGDLAAVGTITIIVPVVSLSGIAALAVVGSPELAGAVFTEPLWTWDGDVVAGTPGTIDESLDLALAWSVDAAESAEAVDIETEGLDLSLAWSVDAAESAEAVDIETESLDLALAWEVTVST